MVLTAIFFLSREIVLGYVEGKVLILYRIFRKGFTDKVTLTRFEEREGAMQVLIYLINIF